MANPSDFFAQMMPYAQQVSQRTGLDPRLVLAQAALETGYGQSAPGNNFFGIKSHGRGSGNVLQTQEFEGGRMVSVPQSFRGYESPEQSFMDYADFVTSNPRYRPVLEAGGLEGQIRAMGASGYATDPNYATKLAQIAGMVDPSVQINIPGRGGNMQPQGLLSTVSTQGQEPEQVPFFQRPETANLLDTLAIGFSGMTLNPNQALIQSAQERIKGRGQAAQTAQQRNRTLEYLRILGTPQAMEAIRYAEATGDVAGALKMAQGGGQYRQITGPDAAAMGLDPSKVYNLGPEGKVTGIGGGDTILQTGMSGEDALRTELLKSQGKILGGIVETAGISAQLAPDINALRELALAGPSGPIQGRLAEMFPEFNDVAAARQAIIRRVAPQMRVEGSGSTSDIEYAGMIESLGRLTNTPEANTAVADAILAKYALDQQRAALVQRYTMGTMPYDEMTAELQRLNEQSILPPSLKKLIGGSAQASPSGGEGGRIRYDAQGNRIE